MIQSSVVVERTEPEASSSQVQQVVWEYSGGHGKRSIISAASQPSANCSHSVIGTTRLRDILLHYEMHHMDVLVINSM
jgi:hypothetical protein